MEQFKNFFKDYGLYIFFGFLALVFLTAVANGEEKNRPFHINCYSLNYVDSKAAFHDIKNNEGNKELIKKGFAKVVKEEHTESGGILSYTFDRNEDGFHEGKKTFTYINRVKQGCILQYEELKKDGKEAQL